MMLACPYFIVDELADEVRAQVAEIANRTREYPDCKHDWRVFTDGFSYYDAGYEAPITCMTCDTHPIEAEARAWWDSPSGKSWLEAAREQTAHTKVAAARRERWQDVRDAIGAVVVGGWFVLAWVVPIVALLTLLI
jgi:hypothetical protein